MKLDVGDVSSIVRYAVNIFVMNVFDDVMIVEMNIVWIVRKQDAKHVTTSNAKYVNL